MSGLLMTVRCFGGLVLLYSVAVAATDHPGDVVEFDVRPGGQVQEYSRDLNGVSCTFKYSCQGGTKETWTFVIKASKDKKKVLCEIERADGKSYLFFGHFAVHLSGAEVKSVKAFKEEETPLESVEYIVDRHANAVESNGQFKSQLSRVRITASVIGNNHLNSNGNDEL